MIKLLAIFVAYFLAKQVDMFIFFAKISESSWEFLDKTHQQPPIG